MSKTTLKTRMIQGVLLGTATLCLSLVNTTCSDAQEKAPAPATLKSAPTAELLLTLDDAIAMAMEKQPAIHAARLSYESSISAKKVTDTPFINLVPEGSIRKKQASAGLNAAAANMQQVDMENW